MAKLKEKLMGWLGGNEVLAFSFTIFGANMVSALMGSALSFFYTEVLYISAAAVGTIFLLARFWDAINDPIMGIIVDRTHTKWGKCIPYLKFVPIPLFIASVFMFLPIQDASHTFKAIYAGFFYILYYALFTAIDIPINGLQSLLFLDQQQRNKAVSVSQTLGSTGTILPGGLYFILVVLVGGSEKSPMGNFIVATTIIGLGCLCIMLSARGLKEKIVLEKPEKKGVWKTIKPLFKNKPLLILLVISLFAAPMGMAGNALVYFCEWNYADSSLNLAVLFPLLQISSGAAWMLSILCVPALLKKFTKKKLFIITAIVGAVVNLLMYFAGYENMWVYIVMKFFANFPGGILATVTTLLIADTIEYTEWKTGERTEGMTYAVVKFVGKTSGALMSSLTLFMLALVDYDSKKMQLTLDQGGSISQTYPEVLNMIFILMTVTTAVAFVLQLLPMFFYKFEGDEQAKVLKELEERRMAKAAEGEATADSAAV